MKKFSTDAFALAGCEFGKSSIPAFLAVYGLTDGNVCETGCAWYRGGQCPAYKKLKFADAPKAVIQKQQETVRETAERLNISIGEVRRQRRQML
jgi:hypothetical protein